MVKIIGNVKPEDDYTHPLGPEPNFNESVYFNFFDRAQNRGGFLRIGNRANEKQAEMTVIVYNADGSADSGFGSDGNLSIDFFGFSDVGENVLVQPDGKIVVSGLATQNFDGYGLARINP